MATKLETLVAAMPARSWAKLNSVGEDGYTNSFIVGDDTGNGASGGIASYQSSGWYDPLTDIVGWNGAPHGIVPVPPGTIVPPNWYVRYNISTHTWSRVATSFTKGHTYDTNEINPEARESYVCGFLNASDFFAVNVDTGLVVPMATPASIGFGAAESSCCFFPDKQELLWCEWQNQTQLARFIFPKSTWSLVPGSGAILGNNTIIGFRGPHAKYSAKYRCVVVFGGADTANQVGVSVFKRGCVRYNLDGSFTRLPDLPSNVFIYPQVGISAVDPVSGEILFLSGTQVGATSATWDGGASFVSLNPSTGVYTQLSTASMPPVTGANSWWATNGNGTGPEQIVAIPISRYGVVMFCSVLTTSDGGNAAVWIYKHTASARPLLTPQEKTDHGGVIGSYLQAGSTRANIRQYPPPAFPLKTNYGVVPVVTSLPGLPDANYPAATAASSGGAVKLSSTGVIYSTLDGLNWTVLDNLDAQITPARLPGEMNSQAVIQGKLLYRPEITAAGECEIQVPSGTPGRVDSQAQGNGGRLLLTLQGNDLPHIRLGPDINGGRAWIQFTYRTHGLAYPAAFNGISYLNGSFANGLIKSIIFGNAPPSLDYIGSDFTMASVMGYSMFHETVWGSYNRVKSGAENVHDRTIGGTLYVQNATLCAYNGSGPYGSPCVRLVDDVDHEVTIHVGLNPVGFDFTVSGTTLTRAAGISAVVGTQIYLPHSIVAGPTNSGVGYFTVTNVNSGTSVTLNGSPGNGSNVKCYISDVANGTFQSWIDGVAIHNLADIDWTWNAQNAGINPGTLAGVGFGESIIQPHMTNKDSSIAHTPGYVRYSNLMFSSQPILMGSIAGSPITPPPPTVTPVAHWLRFRN